MTGCSCKQFKKIVTMSSMTTLQSWLLIIVIFILGGVAGFFIASSEILETLSARDLVSPFQGNTVTSGVAKPLQKYAIENLAAQTFQPSTITVTQITESTETVITALFEYQSQGKTISGQIKLPKNPPTDPAIILMHRGFVPADIYQPGMGTNNVSQVLAENGYITLAPDFLGYGSSDDDYENSWEGRFVKPVQILDLYTTLTTNGITPTQQNTAASLPYAIRPTENIGFWGHSNGGQIALSVLEIAQQPIPTVLWAPVTAPFPYSILYFGDELADEGKAQRAWLAMFEETYDVFDFSLTQHLDKLTGPIQIHQGTGDDAVLQWWTQEFAQKIADENERRRDLETTSTATAAADISEPLPAVELETFYYTGADHNLQPSWQTAVNRTVTFYQQNL